MGGVVALAPRQYPARARTGTPRGIGQVPPWDIDTGGVAGCNPMGGPSFAQNACVEGQDAMNKATSTLRIAFRIVLRSAGRLGIR